MPALNVNVNVKDDVYKTYVKYTKMTGCTMNQVSEKLQRSGDWFKFIA